MLTEQYTEIIFMLNLFISILIRYPFLKNIFKLYVVQHLNYLLDFSHLLDIHKENIIPALQFPLRNKHLGSPSEFKISF